MIFGFMAFGFALCGVALLCLTYVIRAVDFGLLYRRTYKNSMWIFHFCINHQNTAKIMQLEAFLWSGIAANTVMIIQGIIVAVSVVLSGVLRNVFLTAPLFLLMREAFVIAAMFMRRRRKDIETAGLENMLRLFLAEINQTKSRRESLGHITGSLSGVWREAIGKLFRKLGNGSDNTACYAEFAQSFPDNRHVRLLAQLLDYSDTYGGDIKDALAQIIQDVMQDRIEEEKNRSETSATLSIILLINLGVIIIAACNLISSPLLSEALVATFSGKILLASAALCCFISLNTTRKIVEE